MSYLTNNRVRFCFYKPVQTTKMKDYDRGEFCRLRKNIRSIG